MLKNAVKAVLLLGLVYIGTACADDAVELKNILSKYSALSAEFEQTVTKTDGSVISETKGTLSLKKPDKFMLHTTEPDEQLLYTKGLEVYFYDPFVNQVTIFDRSSIYTSPFALLTSADSKVWNNYSVKKQGDGFLLTPLRSELLTKIVLLLANETLKELKVTFKDGNTSHYRFSSVADRADEKVFDYTLPADVQVDDERRSK